MKRTSTDDATWTKVLNDWSLTSLKDHSSCADCHEESSREDSEDCDTDPTADACCEVELQSLSLWWAASPLSHEAQSHRPNSAFTSMLISILVWFVYYRCMGKATGAICDFVSVCVCTVKEKRLELSTPNSVQSLGMHWLWDQKVKVKVTLLSKCAVGMS